MCIMGSSFISVIIMMGSSVYKLKISGSTLLIWLKRLIN